MFSPLPVHSNRQCDVSTIFSLVRRDITISTFRLLFVPRFVPDHRSDYRSYGRTDRPSDERAKKSSRRPSDRGSQNRLLLLCHEALSFP